MVGTQMTIESGRGRVKVVDKPSLVGGVMGKPARKITLGHKWSECGFIQSRQCTLEGPGQ